MNSFWELERHGDSTAVITPDGQHLSYRELAQRADQLACQFPKQRSLGIIQCRNHPDTLIAYLACLRHGHLAILVDATMPLAQRDKLATAYHAEWHFDANGRFTLTGQTAQAPDKRAALLLSTSGSTGSPKQVVLSRDNLNANAISIAEYLAIGPKDRPITTLPFQYSYGLSVINSHLLQGATLLMSEDALVTKEFWAFFQEAGATSLAGVPTLYDILQRLRFEKMDLPSLQTLTQAGGRLATEQVRHFARLAKDRGWRFFVMYGQTEATARMAYLSPDLMGDFPDYIGQAIPGGQFWLEDAAGRQVEDMDSEGELIYQGPNVMLGYTNCREELNHLTPPDVLRTGDLAIRNNAGLYRITGRLKRIIKLHGHRIALDEVEQLFRAAGHEVICGGDDKRLIIGHLPTEQPEPLTAFASERLRIPASAVQCLALETWPTTESGKIAYQKLVELA